jgi:hypothetical protein
MIFRREMIIGELSVALNAAALLEDQNFADFSRAVFAARRPKRLITSPRNGVLI